MSSVWQNPEVFMGFLFSISVSRDSASYFIAMIMLINLECTLAQTRMEFGRVTCPSKGSMGGQFVFLTAKSRSFYVVYFQLLYLKTLRPVSSKCLLFLECTLAQTRMGFGRVTLHSKGHMRSQSVFFMAKSESLL